MTIPALGSSSLAALRAQTGFARLKGDLDTLTGQLATGKTATTYAGLGAGAPRSLALSSALSGLDATASGLGDAATRVSLMSTGVTQIATQAAKLAPGLATTATSITATTSVATANADLQTAIDVLNTAVGGRYLFAGRAGDTEPVASAGLILDGDATHAGLRTLIAQRGAADIGASGTGRLTASAAGSTVTLSGESPAQPFGMTVAAASSGTAAITASRSAGPPATATFALGSQPAAGDAVTVTLALPDGSTTAVTLTAATGGSAAGTFAVGATTSDTAANLSAALTAALKAAASTALASASAVRTTTDFFAATPASPPPRVAGPPYDTATAVTAGTVANTVVWYRGDAGPGDARDTAPVALGDGSSVGIGTRASEPAFRSILAGFAALAASTFDETDPNSDARYTALAGRVTPLLASSDAPDSIGGVSADLSLANARITSARTSTAERTAQLKDALAGIEDADPATVATQLMATQTRLSASYQATATIARLTLADYL